jgi:hypothetical protein
MRLWCSPTKVGSHWHLAGDLLQHQKTLLHVFLIFLEIKVPKVLPSQPMGSNCMSIAYQGFGKCWVLRQSDYNGIGGKVSAEVFEQAH